MGGRVGQLLSSALLAVAMLVASAGGAGAQAVEQPLGLPGAPTQVRVYAVDAAAVISWTAPAGEVPVTGYVVRSWVAGELVGSLAVAPARRPRATVTGLANGTPHAFTVAAVGDAGEGEQSSPTEPVTPLDATPPGPVARLAAAGADGRAHLSWTNPPDADLAGVRVWVRQGTDPPSTDSLPACDVAAPRAGCTLQGLAEGHPHTLAVVAHDVAGNAGEPQMLTIRGTRLSAAASVPTMFPGTTTTITGVLTGDDGRPLGGQRVALQTRAIKSDGTWSSWREVTALTTSPDGRASAPVAPTASGQYRLHFAGAGGVTGARGAPAGVSVLSRPFATVAGVPLHPVSMRTLVTGYHQAGASGRPLALQTSAKPLNNFGGTLTLGRVPVHTTITMPSRKRGTASTSAVDLAVPRNVPITSPVTGRVREVRTYSLYGRTPDRRISITPDGKPGLDVVVLHVAGTRVARGQRVVAGRTVVADRARVLPFSSQIERWAGPLPHVHVEVQRR
jgi:hypothetical protein